MLTLAQRRVATVAASMMAAAAVTSVLSAPANATTAQTEYCLYKPRDTVAHYFSLATYPPVVKGVYSANQTFYVPKPGRYDTVDGVEYVQRAASPQYWLRTSAIIRVPRTECATT
ncbi:hypothetical protein [Fodinicola feengrottensis]|uniref:Secreted protein n=1 Tax=Fodinicola feengrottensis TaxID=435914 RepID=A0ABN2GKU7_9ACTN|nr:hypothetical protein [Fodinicola feengrottensis]